MKKITVLLFTLLLIGNFSCEQKAPAEEEEKVVALSDDERMAWWRDASFGMFIHWGPYAVLGGEWKGEGLEEGQIAEWIMKWKEIPVEEYREVAASFNPTGFNAEEWVKLAKNTGMKYLVITAGLQRIDQVPDPVCYRTVPGQNIVHHTRVGLRLALFQHRGPLRPRQL